MESVIDKINAQYKKKAVVNVRSGDTVKVSQKIRERGKERIQVFEGLVIRTSRKNSHTSSFTVRKIASGIGVEKTYFIHSPNVLKVEVTKRAKVRRNYLTYMRKLTGKNARLMGVDFDREKVNIIHDEEAEAEEEKLKEAAEKAHEEKEAKEAEKKAKEESKAEEALDKHKEKAAESEKSDTEDKK
jgi:large subunit ribosomal protein L19